MCKVTIKILTLLSNIKAIVLIGLISNVTIAAVFMEEPFKTHLRWKFAVAKSDLAVKKTKQTIKFQTLDLNIFKKLKNELSTYQLPSKYFKNLKYSTDGFPERPATIDINLSNSGVEFFTFYKKDEKKIIIDFWRNQIIEEDKSLDKKEKKKIVKKVKRNQKVISKKKIENIAKKIVSKPKREVANRVKPYRDFRYGLSFVWDYEPIIPSVEKRVNLERKTIETFYPIKDREYQEDEKEAHVQLTINLYRKNKWGLMKKSIDLYNQKYGTDSNSELLKFIKLNSLLVKYRLNKDEASYKASMTMFQNLADGTKDYKLRKAIYKFSIEYYRQQDNNLKVLNISKKLFVDSRENYDVELAEYSLNMVLHTLAKLGQWEKIEEISKEKGLDKIISPSKMVSYKIYVLMNKKENTKAIKLYEKNRKNLETGKISAPIYFNIAEAYFREAQYEKSLKLFDRFSSKYSYFKESPAARLRIALIYDLTSRDIKKVEKLYLNTVNRSPISSIRFEAKMRYLGVVLLRKRQINKNDKEIAAFLNYDDSESADVKKSKVLQESLWLMRLRTLIVDNKFEEALSYLQAIPTNSLEPVKRRVFLGDGAEIVYGNILNHFLEEKYSTAVRLWEKYQDKYDNKVAADPYANFIISKSYMKLGLKSSFEKTVEKMEKLANAPLRTFPIWLDRDNKLNSENLIGELKIIHSISAENYSKAEKDLKSYALINKNFKKIAFYEGVIAFKKKEYKKSKKKLESFISKQSVSEVLSKDQIADLFYSYTETLYQLNDMKNFKQASRAILKDIDNLARKSKKVRTMTERVRYLLIETLASEEVNVTELEKRTLGFLQDYEGTTYKNRVKFLLGKSLVKNKKNEEGTKVLNEILNDNQAPTYIKELVKSELSSMKIKKITI